MTCRIVIGALVATWAVIAVAPAQAQLLPRDQSGDVILVGCLQRIGDDGDDWRLANPVTGPINSVPDGRCSDAVDENALELEDESRHRAFLQDSRIGMVVEVTGRLEKEESDDPENHREIQVDSIRLVPVIPPQQTQVIEVPVPAVETPAPIPTPVPTTGQEPTLPKTAGEAPAIGLLGLLALAGGMMLRLRRSTLLG